MNRSMNKNEKGSKPATIIIENVAENKSKNKPAYAHSFSLLRFGSRMPMTPKILATPIYETKYVG